MGAKSLKKISLVPCEGTAELFEQMRIVSAQTRPWARNITSLRVRFPEEPVTLDESLEFADEMGKRRIAARTIARLSTEESSGKK